MHTSLITSIIGHSFDFSFFFKGGERSHITLFRPPIIRIQIQCPKRSGQEGWDCSMQITKANTILSLISTPGTLKMIERDPHYVNIKCKNKFHCNTLPALFSSVLQSFFQLQSFAKENVSFYKNLQHLFCTNASKQPSDCI